MIQASTSTTIESGRPAARTGWRLLACCLALLALALLVVSPATFCAEAATAEAPGISALLSVDDAGTTDRTDLGQAQHCSHCGCQGMARLGHADPAPLPSQTPVRFATWHEDGPRRTPAPLLEPPRA